MVVGAHTMEIDTFNKQSNGKDGGGKDVNPNFRSAQTPKHCNKGINMRPQSNGMHHFQPQAYPGYGQGQNSYRPPGLYNSNHRAPNGASPYYAPPGPSVMVSPRGASYMRPPPGSYYPGSDYDAGYSQYPSHRYQHHQQNQYQNHHQQQQQQNQQHQKQQHQQPPMYGAGMPNRSTYDPRSQTGYPNQTGMDFSRAVSTSFGDGNSKSSADKLEKESTDSLPNFGNFYKGNNDDRSVASKAESDTSWKLLNQVASIEEENFRHSEAGRSSATSPFCGRSSRADSIDNNKKSLSEPMSSRMGPLTSFSSVASVQEPIDTSNSKDELDLIQCSSSGSLLFTAHDDTFPKRPREERGDAGNDFRGGEYDEIRKGPSPPAISNILIKDESNHSRPPKKRRGSDIEDCFSNPPPPTYSFSIDSAPSFTKYQQSGTSSSLLEKTRASSHLAPYDNHKDEYGSNKADNLLWDMKGQDSFGGALSVGSNDGPLITSSFSFGKECNDEHDNNAAPIKLEDNSSNNSMSCGNLDQNSNKSLRGKLPPPSATWVTHNSSFNRDPSEFHSQHHPIGRTSNLYGSNRLGAVGSFNSSAPSHGHNSGAKHSREMMRNFSQDSGRSSPSGIHSLSRYGPLHGPYGAPLPLHIPQSDAHLPPSFRPPPPSMVNPGHMRRPPQAVYVMSSAPVGRQDMSRQMSIDSTISKATGGVYSWTKQDDERLTEIMKKFKNPKDWEPIAKEFGSGKTAKECHERWIRYLKPGVRKGQWQDHEDAIVVEAVSTSKEQPFTRWSDLAQRLPGRVGKQIRDRWVNHLNPNINHMPFTREDDLLLWDGHKKLGKRWVEISSKYFNSSRSENHIKNRWYSASFKKFIANEFGPDAYSGGKKKDTKSGK